MGEWSRTGFKWKETTTAATATGGRLAVTRFRSSVSSVLTNHKLVIVTFLEGSLGLKQL